MTEQMATERRSYVDDVGALFGDYADPDGRECIAGDLREIGAEEVARQFARAEELLHGLHYTAEFALGWGAMMVLGEAEKLAREGRTRAQRHIRREA